MPASTPASTSASTSAAVRRTPQTGHPDLTPQWMVRGLARFYVGGGLLALFWITAPHDDRQGDRAVLVLSVCALAMGGLMLSLRHRPWPRWSLHLCLMVVQAIITVGVVATDSATTDGRFFYAWATPYSALFFGRRGMSAHIAWIGLCQVVALLLIGDPLWLSLRSFMMATGTVVAVGVLVSLAADRMRAGQEALRHSASHDSLTGLLNRRGLTAALDDGLAECRAVGGSLTVLLLDLDRFKLVNDMHGHHAGDRLLAQVAPRLLAAVRPGDVVGRMGGDEFAIVCRDLDRPLELEQLLDRLRESCREPVHVGAWQVAVSASIGVAFAPGGAGSAGDLLCDADVAMYRAKETQRGTTVLFDESFRARLSREAELDRGLREALELAELSLAYQAVVDVGTGRVVGAEALLRWTSAELGPVGPQEFIPLAEDRGLIDEIGRWTLGQGCRQLARWRADGLVGDDFELALNVSGRQLQPGFASVVERTLARHGLPVCALALEITESVLLDDSPDTVLAITELDRLGVRLLLDDFGTGFSSLSYLQRFPLAGLKIDKSFVHAVTTSGRQRALVRAMLAMAGALGMTVIAEGIETSDVAATLHELGCVRAQGYYWARPEPEAAFSARLAHSSAVARVEPV